MAVDPDPAPQERAAAPIEHRLRRRVEFYETDAAGLAHFTAFFRYMEEAEHALWRALGLSIHPPHAEIGFPRVAASFEYQRPLRFEDEFEVVITVSSITSRAIQYACRIVKGETTIATGSLTVACVRKRPHEPLQPIDIPPEIAARFTR
jgi:YbgC/YbaW family acyl-CoA thioester hydrolase